MRISAAFTFALLLLGFVGLAGSAAQGQQLTPLYNFCAQANCTDGSAPSGSLIQGSDGNFYGTTLSGGKNGQGTVFKVTTTGTLTPLYSFCAIGTDCTDGAQPGGGVIEGIDGNFYGTTVGGGLAGTYDECGGANNLGGAPAIFTCGTVFKLTPNGELTTLYTFLFTDRSSQRQLLLRRWLEPVGSLDSGRRWKFLRNHAKRRHWRGWCWHHLRAEPGARRRLPRWLEPWQRLLRKGDL